MVTVSMNLVDHEVTGPVAAFDAVVAEAHARGLVVVDSEIVGLAPEAALGPGVAEHVRLAGFDPAAQVLERLAEEGS
jgi:glutamate formiminotransferase